MVWIDAGVEQNDLVFLSGVLAAGDELARRPLRVPFARISICWLIRVAGIGKVASSSKAFSNPVSTSSSS